MYKMLRQRPRKTDIKDLTRAQLVLWLEERRVASYRAGQIRKWIYQRQATTFETMTDLGNDFRKLLSDHFIIEGLVTERVETSTDGSMKYLFRLKDDYCIESVLIPEKDHYTLCISSQVGCAQGCRFCLTARGGFVRNLTTGEIISQVLDIKKYIKSKKNAAATMPLTNIVLMGMGEPLENYQNVVQAVAAMTDTDTGLQFSNRRITVSTAGIAPRLADLGRDTRVHLAVSLNATNNRTRSMLMPINRTYPLEALLDACRRYDLKPRQRITFEYILIARINDSPEDAERLAGLLGPIKAKVNLIPFNEFAGSEFKRPPAPAIRAFQEILVKHNYTAVIRQSRGQDISAACGQLHANIGIKGQRSKVDKGQDPDC
jgi:23S rRNA (adenine2503-C2)-methyltransferase